MNKLILNDTVQLLFKFKLYFYSTFLFVMADIRLQLHINAKSVQLVLTQKRKFIRADKKIFQREAGDFVSTFASVLTFNSEHL